MVAQVICMKMSRAVQLAEVLLHKLLSEEGGTLVRTISDARKVLKRIVVFL